jgi:hypothetical protein
LSADLKHTACWAQEKYKLKRAWTHPDARLGRVFVFREETEGLIPDGHDERRYDGEIGWLKGKEVQQ